MLISFHYLHRIRLQVIDIFIYNIIYESYAPTSYNFCLNIAAFFSPEVVKLNVQEVRWFTLKDNSSRARL
jgi:hypothetical protein